MAIQKGKMSFSNAAYTILKTAKRPLGPAKIAELAIERGIIETSSKRPAATMASRLLGDDRFVSAGSGKWMLK